MTTVIEKNATAAPVKSDTAAPRLLDQVRERIRVLHYALQPQHGEDLHPLDTFGHRLSFRSGSG